MKSQTRYIPFLGIALCAAAIELFLVPGIGKKLGVAFALIISAIIGMARHFGSGPVKRALGAIGLGTIASLISSHMVALTAGMGFRMPECLCLVASFGPTVLSVFVMSKYPAPRFIGFSFISGMALGWILMIILAIYA